MDDETRRAAMVREQIEARGITDPRVLEAMREVPRHLFMPVTERGHAYGDTPLPIGEGQTISQPYIVALMSQALAVGAGHRVLEIGTGSGYQTAILSRLAQSVLSVERRDVLAERARTTLRELGHTNIEILVGDGSLGAADRGPFDRILVTAGAPAVPDALREQLADGGRLVIPVGPGAMQHLMTIDRRGNTFEEHRGEACVFVPLIGRHGWPDDPHR